MEKKVTWIVLPLVSILLSLILFFFTDFNFYLTGAAVGLKIDNSLVSNDLAITDTDWWNTSFLYRVPFNISVAGGSTPASIEVYLSLNSSTVSNKFNWSNNCNDLRFVNGSNEAVSYWIDHCGTNNATVWVNFPTNITSIQQTIYLYYGNNEVKNQSNGSVVFAFFDDFNDGDFNSSPTWSAASGTWAVFNGVLNSS